MFAFRTKQQHWGQPQLKNRLAIHLSLLVKNVATTLSVNPVTSGYGCNINPLTQHIQCNRF